MSEVIVVTSGKGGVGKTSATANIGVGLARSGKKTLIIDMDLGLRNLDVMIGMENRIIYNLTDVIGEKCQLKDAMMNYPDLPELSFLPAPQTKDKTAITSERMKNFLDELKEQFDYIILDCPSGIDLGFYHAIAGAERAVVITTPDILSVRDADRVIGLLRENKIFNINLILNRIRADLSEQGNQMSVEDVTDILPVDLIGMIPEDDSVIISCNQGTPVILSESTAGIAYHNICERILGNEVSFPDLHVQKGFFKTLSGFFKKN